jgi:hypothetical protein
MKIDSMKLQPLHLAVEAGAIKAVELLLACSHAANAIRDSDGCLPLHIAVRRGFSRIAKSLINASPSTLCVEDGVGSTAFESTVLNRFRKRMDRFTRDDYIPQVGRVDASGAEKDPERLGLAHLEKELPRLRKTIDSLLKVGKLRKDTKLEKELVRFAEMMGERMRRLQQTRVEPKKPEEENPTDVEDFDATYDVVKGALDRIQARYQRELVHLIDVQKSVDRGMKRSSSQKPDIVGDDMHVEEKESETSFVLQHASIDLVYW